MNEKKMIDGLAETVRYHAKLNKVPERMIESLVAYVIHGIEPGGFLMAIIRNDLQLAWTRADGENRPLIGAYVQTLLSSFPIACYGDNDTVRSWIVDRGYAGYLEK